MPNKYCPLVDRHAPKNGIGLLENTQQGKVCSFTNNSPTAYAQWVAPYPVTAWSRNNPVGIAVGLALVQLVDAYVANR